MHKVLDFNRNIWYTSCEDIQFTDRSTWQSGGGSYSLSIFDEEGHETTYQVIAGQPTYINLGKCAEGIYTLKATSCTKTHIKSVAILCNLKCGWLRAVSKLGAEDSMVKSIDERLSFIDYAVRYDDIKTAKDLLKTVKRDLRRINCQCECH